jgi:uracil-DNA glycosylase family 4
MEARTDILSLLRLHLEWGADEALEPDPVDRMSATSPPVPRLEPQPQPAPVVPRGTPAERAVALAGQADSLAALRAAMSAFDGCGLRETASNLVFADGDPASGLLLVGEAPGADEDRAGTPFAGPEGVFLDKMLASIGLTRAEMLLVPLIPWRPPGGRPPNPGELAVCLPFLHRLIALAQPRRIVVMGGLAARSLAGPTASRRRSPPDWVDLAVPGVPRPFKALLLPGLTTLLKTPTSRRDAWAGLRLLRRSLDQDTGDQDTGDQDTGDHDTGRA